MKSEIYKRNVEEEGDKEEGGSESARKSAERAGIKGRLESRPKKTLWQFKTFLI